MVPPNWRALPATGFCSTAGIASLDGPFSGVLALFFGGKPVCSGLRRLGIGVLLAHSAIAADRRRVSDDFDYSCRTLGRVPLGGRRRVPSIGPRLTFSFLILTPLGALAASGIWQLMLTRPGTKSPVLWLASSGVLVPFTFVSE